MESDRKDRIASPESRPTAPETPPQRSLDSRDLLAGGREVTIRHGESLYRLRSTNKGKLILTK